MSAHETQPGQQRAVALLSKQCNVPVAEVTRLYEHEWARLAVGAHITKFLHIFALRNVQEILRNPILDKEALPLRGGLSLLAT